MVPNGWDVRPLVDIAIVTSGGTPSRANPEYWQNGTIPWIRTTEVQNCILHPGDTREYISEQGLKNSSAKSVPPGTVLLAMIGQGKTRGQVALLRFEATTNQNCAAIIFNNDQEPEFHFNFLLSQYENIRGMSNSAGQSNLSGALVKAIRVPVPPLPEQKKIAQILSTWDKAITTTEQLLANSQQQKKALMQQLLAGKKRLLDKNGVRFDGEWKRKSLSRIVDVYNEKSTSNNQFPIITSSRRGLFLQENYFKKQVASEDNTGYKIVPKGYVTFRSMSDDGIFVFNRQTLLENALISPAYGVFVFASIDSDFGMYLINSHLMTREIKRLSQGGTRIALKTSVFTEIFLKIPCLEEQQKIAVVLSAVDQEINALQQKLDVLKQEKKALMQQLLTGKCRVKIEETA